MAHGWPAIVTRWPSPVSQTGDSPAPSADRLRPGAVDVGQLGLDVLVDEQQRLGHRHLDPLAHAGAIPLVQRGEDGRQRVSPAYTSAWEYGSLAGSPPRWPMLPAVIPISAWVITAYARRPAHGPSWP